MRPILGVLLLTTTLAGCETMFTHFRLNEQTVDQIAKGNAATNFCLANGAVNKNMGFAFNSVSAQLLEITVLDRDYYRDRYQAHFAQAQGMPASDIRANCAELEKKLPMMVERLSQQYMNISADLHAARAQERQQMATMLSNFGSSWASQSYSATTATYGYPKVSFTDARPESVNYLVNTSKGLVQCKVSAKNYVFCM
jgi:hypothetical protein